MTSDKTTGILSCTFGVSILSSSINAGSPRQLGGGNEKASAPEVGGRPGDCNSLAFGECKLTEGTAACA